MQDKYLLETFVKGYEQHLDPRDGAIDTVLKGSSLYNLFLWGYRLAERHAQASMSDVEYELHEYADEVRGLADALSDTLTCLDRGDRGIVSAQQLKHYANSIMRFSDALYDYIDDIAPPEDTKKEPTQSDQE